MRPPPSDPRRPPPPDPRRLPGLLRTLPALALGLAVLRAAAPLDAATASVFHALGFWAALLAWEHAGGPVEDAGRFVVGLAAGAGLAHVGWLALHPAQAGAVAPWLAWQAGYAAVCVPAGPLLLAPPATDPVRRRHYLEAALGALPFGLATARLGCLTAGCCDGTQLPASLAPLLDVGVLLGLGCAATQGRALAHPAARVGALGAANLLNHALREPGAAPLAPLAAVALALVGLAWRACPAPPSDATRGRAP